MNVIRRTQVGVAATFGLLLVVSVLLDQADLGTSYRFSTPVDREIGHQGTDDEVGPTGQAADINDQSIHSESAAAQSLGDDADPLAISNFLALLDDPDPIVREEAIESLAMNGSAESIAGIGYALSDTNSTVRQLAIELLAEIGSDQAVSTLALSLNDTDVDNRLLAVEEIGIIGSAAAALVLQSFLADEDERVKSIAAEYYFGIAER